jgi:hypothetical protein
MQLDVDWHRQCIYSIEEGYVRCIEKTWWAGLCERFFAFCFVNLESFVCVYVAYIAHSAQALYVGCL